MIDFEKDIIERSHHIPIVVEFSTPSCGPCQWMEKTLIDVTRTLSGKIEFVSLPSHNFKDLIECYKIKSNPTTIIFIKGKDVARLKGALPLMAVEQWIRDHVEG